MKRYKIDDFLNGQMEPDKISNLTRDLRAEVLKQEPVQESDIFILRLMREGKGGYRWELYRHNESIVVIEKYGERVGFYSEIHSERLVITVHDSTPDLEREIERIIAKYPSGSKE